MGQYLPCFKAYDIRGKVPSELNEEVAYAVGRAFAQETGAKMVCVGHDIRLSGPGIADALIRGLNAESCNVQHLGMVGTEMVYFATAEYGYDGGIMITASHNPPEYNGMKMVRAGSRPISGDSGLLEIEARTIAILNGDGPVTTGQGVVSAKDVYQDFIRHLIKVCPTEGIEKFRVLACPGNGAAGPAIKMLEAALGLQVDYLYDEPDGNFPNGVPNPILPESRAPVELRLKEQKYDLGVAWDGDYDRCFFLDESGRFIEGYYIVGLLAKSILAKNPGGKIIYDPRLTWNTIEIVKEAGGVPVLSKSGHAFIKERMRQEDAVYGGEMSAHHYFRDHWYCDSGMIPLLYILNLMAQTGKGLGELVSEMMEKYPCSGEINSTVEDIPSVIQRVESHFSGGEIDRTDGLSMEFPTWRFNLRGSNTEPVLRLNVETRGDQGLMQEKTDEILTLIRS